MKDSRGTSELSAGTRVSLFAGGAVIRALATTWRYKTIGESTMTRFRAEKSG